MLMRWPAVLILTALVAPGPGFAQDAESSDFEEEFDFLVEGEKNAARIAATKGASADDFSAYDEEEEFADFELRPKAPKVAPRLPYSLAGKAPLGDNYDATVVFSERDAVVVELPVLVARSPADFKGGDFWLVGEALQGGTVVAASRSWVSAGSLAQSGPTLAFVKMLVPVSSAAGDLEIRVSRLEEGQSTPTVLFSRSVSYQLRQ
jgi:hypothetical protein